MSPKCVRVLTGCQMEGLVSAIRILFPSCDVEGFHTYRLLGDDRDAIHDNLRAADLVFALPLDGKFGDLAADRIGALGPRIQFVPHVVYAAFHPDITYLERGDGTRVYTPMIDYNSIIAVAAFRLGLDVAHTVRLYNSYIYQALGYFDCQEASGRSLISDFRHHGVDLGSALQRWLRTPEPFMYSMNHPRSFVLADVALEACRAAGLHVGRRFPEPAAMPDRLAEWIIYPVFPEIAARFGKVGDAGFKLTAEQKRTLSLDEYVEQSFIQYERENMADWDISERIDRTTAVIGRLLERPRSRVRQATVQVTRAAETIFATPVQVASLDACFFYHTTDLPGHGTQPGPWDLRGRFSDYIGGLDLAGRRVLDVGAASGFLSFSAEEAGASEVVSFDLDSADRQHLLPFAESEYVTDHASWSAKQSAAFQRWKNAYWFTHRLKASKAKVVYGDVYDMPAAMGQFDVVIVGAILEHLSDPIRALASISKRAREYLIINTDYIESDQTIAQFNGRSNLPDASYIFWTYSLKTYEQVVAILGFETVSVKKEIFATPARAGQPVTDVHRAVLVCRRKEKRQVQPALQSAA